MARGAANMAQKLSDRGLHLLAGASLLAIFGSADVRAQDQRPPNVGIGKPPYNIVFVIVDQLAYRPPAAPGYSLPGIDTIARHGVTQVLDVQPTDTQCAQQRQHAF